MRNIFALAQNVLFSNLEIDVTFWNVDKAMKEKVSSLGKYIRALAGSTVVKHGNRQLCTMLFTENHCKRWYGMN